MYAIETLESAFHKARERVESLGLSDRIIVIRGDATEVSLPEKVDVCVSEVVGSIGGSEAAAYILNQAWRFLAEGGAMIPERSLTRIAAVTMPETYMRSPSFSPLTADYTKRIFEQVGRPFDLRICPKGASIENLISTTDIFEDLDFRRRYRSNRPIRCVSRSTATRDWTVFWCGSTCTPTLNAASTFCATGTAGCRFSCRCLMRAFWWSRGLALKCRSHSPFPPTSAIPIFTLRAESYSSTAQRGLSAIRALTSQRGSARTASIKHSSRVSARNTEEQRLVAYVVSCPDSSDARALSQELEDQVIGEWASLYESGASPEVSGENDSDFDFSGWNDSYTGLPIPTGGNARVAIANARSHRGLWPRQSLGDRMRQGPDSVSPRSAMFPLPGHGPFQAGARSCSPADRSARAHPGGAPAPPGGRLRGT